MPGTEEYKSYNFMGSRPNIIVSRDHNLRIKAEDEDQNMLGVMSSGGKTAKAGERGTDLPDIVGCSKNAWTGKIDGSD